jgi:lipoprotein NlpI
VDARALLALVFAAVATPPATAATPPTAAATPPVAAAGVTEDPTPLLTYASAHHFPPIYDATAQYAFKKRLSQVTFDLSKDPPPESNCAQTLGAKRFAFQLDDLGGLYASVGDDAKAADAYTKAIMCNPRAEFLRAQLASALLGSTHYDEARLEAERQLTVGRANFSLYTLLTQLDFIQERWHDATTHARLAVTEAPDDEQAAYWQCFLWLAQKRAGTADPTVSDRRPPATWPAPILDYLRGKITETDVVEAVAETHDIHRQHEILTEALFYTGEKRLAENQTAAGTKYLTATADLQVPYFIEHHLALAELAKLRHH